MAPPRLRGLTERGQSVWPDFISRRLVTRGRLRRLIDGDLLTGMAGNHLVRGIAAEAEALGGAAGGG